MVVFTTRPPTDPGDDYYKCACGVRVHSFICGLAIYEMVISALALVGLFAAGAVLLIPVPLILFALAALLFWGNRNMVWWTYILELCSWVVSTFSYALVTVFTIFYGLVALVAPSQIHNSELFADSRKSGLTPAEQALGFLVLGLFFALFTLLYAYITSIVARAFQYVYKFGRSHQKIPSGGEYY